MACGYTAPPYGSRLVRLNAPGHASTHSAYGRKRAIDDGLTGESLPATIASLMSRSSRGNHAYDLLITAASLPQNCPEKSFAYNRCRGSPLAIACNPMKTVAAETRR